MHPLLFRVRINSHRKNKNKQTKGQLVKHVARAGEFEMIEGHNKSICCRGDLCANGGELAFNVRNVSLYF